MMLQFLHGCTNNHLFDPDAITEITVRPNDSNGQRDVIIIADRTKITEIIEVINEGTEEMIKFYPKCHLIIIDSRKNEYLVMSGENEIKFNGKTYRLKRNIEALLFN